MKLAILVMLTILGHTGSLAAEELERERENTTEVVNLLSSCSGFYKFLARMADQNKMPEVAKQFLGAARGAKFSAAYLLSVEARASGRERKLGEFSEYVDNIAELSDGRMKASQEIGDSTAIEEQGEQCKIAMELQKELVQELRDQMIDRKP